MESEQNLREEGMWVLSKVRSSVGLDDVGCCRLAAMVLVEAA